MAELATVEPGRAVLRDARGVHAGDLVAVDAVEFDQDVLVGRRGVDASAWSARAARQERACVRVSAWGRSIVGSFVGQGSTVRGCRARGRRYAVVLWMAGAR